MGLAEVVPGVSGGTIAFITGIYEQLIRAIKSIDMSLIRKLVHRDFDGFAKQLNLAFLLPLIIGMFSGIVAGVFGVHYLLEEFPILVWSFFFGLILASALFMALDIRSWTWQSIVLLIIGAILAYLITTFSPVEQSDFSYIYLFFGGAIAICALILPGISGSFILLLLGLYTFVISTVKTLLSDFSGEAFITMTVFGLGCIVGLLTFSRVLSFLFSRFKTYTIATMIGFILGALNKIWPWQKVTAWLSEDGVVVTTLPETHLEEYKVLSQNNVLPGQYEGDPMTLAAILAAILGFVLIALLFKKQSTATT